MIGFRKSSIHMFRSFDKMKENTRILMDMKVRYQCYSIEEPSRVCDRLENITIFKPFFVTHVSIHFNQFIRICILLRAKYHIQNIGHSIKIKGQIEEIMSMFRTFIIEILNFKQNSTHGS